MCEERWIEDVMTSDPGTLLRTVVLPVYEVFQPGTPTPRVKDGPDPIDGLLVCDLRRRKYLIATRFCGERQRFRVRFEERYMERW